MRLIFAAIVVLSASLAVTHPAQAWEGAETLPGHATWQAPVGHRQPTREDADGTGREAFDTKNIDKDNELLALPPSQDNAGGAGHVQADENALAKRIEQENDRLDRQLRDICRGC